MEEEAEGVGRYLDCSEVEVEVEEGAGWAARNLPMAEVSEETEVVLVVVEMAEGAAEAVEVRVDAVANLREG